jgi:hypothetical protein
MSSSSACSAAYRVRPISKSARVLKVAHPGLVSDQVWDGPGDGTHQAFHRRTRNPGMFAARDVNDANPVGDLFVELASPDQCSHWQLFGCGRSSEGRNISRQSIA